MPNLVHLTGKKYGDHIVLILQIAPQNDLSFSGLQLSDTMLISAGQ